MQKQLPTKKENKGKRKQTIINKNYGRIWHVENTASKFATNKITFYNNIRSEDPDVILLNEHRIRDNGKIKINGYKTEWKNLSNQARDGAVLAIKEELNTE